MVTKADSEVVTKVDALEINSSVIAAGVVILVTIATVELEEAALVVAGDLHEDVAFIYIGVDPLTDR